MHNKGYLTFLTGKRIILIFFPVLFISPQYSYPSENYPLGSRAAAMGNATVMISDLWSVHHNQAGLASLTAIQAGFHYENRYFLPELGLHALAIAVPASPGTLALSYTYFGFTQYNESKLGLAFGRMFGERISAGIQLNYLHTFISGDYGSGGNLTVEGGIIIRALEGLLVAAHLYNPARTKNIVSYGEPLPVILRVGMAGLFGENILTSVEAQKETGRRTVFKAGLETVFHGPFFLRAGITTVPVQGSFGLGYIHGKLTADLAFTNHQQLGYSPHITINYIIR
jgi:hypothetical protein